MLPKIDVPTFTMKLKSNDQKITCRPYLVKEEKIMLIAAQTEDPASIKEAIRQVITNCVVEPGDFDVEELPLTDIEWILINLRMNSVGDPIIIDYECKQEMEPVKDEITGEEVQTLCNTPFQIKVSLKDMKTDPEDYPDKELWITDNIMLTMRYPRFEFVKEDQDPNNINDLDIIKEAVESVYDKNTDQYHKLEESTDKDIIEFFDRLSIPEFEKIRVFLSSMPRYYALKTHTCENCGKEHTLVVDDLQSFF